jgi:glycosyltransferase 2 family protein
MRLIKSMKNLSLFALKVIISVALIWWMIDKIDFQSAKQQILGSDYWMLLLSAMAFMSQALVGGFRWCAVSKAIGERLSGFAAVRIFYVGTFFNQALPGGSGGDAVRMYMAYRQGMSARGCITSVIIDRIAIVLSLAILIALTCTYVIDATEPKNHNWIFGFVILLVAGTGTGVAVIAMLDRLPIRFNRWRIIRGLARLACDIRCVFGSVSNAFPVLFWGLIGNANLSLCLYLLAVAIGLQVSLLEFLALMPVVLLIVNIPISIGGWGVREGVMVGVLGLVGVSDDGAFMLSVLFGVGTLILSIPGGLIWLASKHRSRDVKLPTKTDEGVAEASV